MAHTLTLRQTCPYPQGYFTCNLCYERGSGPVYHCADCSFDLHPSCVATDKLSTHFSHFQHPLSLKLLTVTTHTCDSCNETVFPWSYRCDLCDFDMHAHCVRAPRFLLHPRHPHVLNSVNSSELPGIATCNCCGKHVSKMVYRCVPCDFDLHPSCALLPSSPCHSQHPGHRLSLLSRPAGNLPAFSCDECRQEGTKWVYHCATCEFNLHPHCAKLLHQVPSAAATRATTSDVNPSVNPTDIEAVERVLDFVRQQIALPSQFTALSGGRIIGTPIHVRHTQSRNGGSSSTTLSINEQDICSTCLEGYCPENPKKHTVCGHHFHAACILEWMERSNRCPLCRREIMLDENS